MSVVKKTESVCCQLEFNLLLSSSRLRFFIYIYLFQFDLQHLDCELFINLTIVMLEIIVDVFSLMYQKTIVLLVKFHYVSEHEPLPTEHLITGYPVLKGNM